MGYCDSPAQFGGHGPVWAAGGGARGAVAQRVGHCSDKVEADRLSMRPRRIGARLLLVALRVYQGYVSPLLPSACKFYPSCSRYACEAIERWGARQGIWLALRRVLRCRPLARGGCDPVPEPGEAVR